MIEVGFPRPLCPEAQLSLFTYRDSGGFYMEGKGDAVPDFDHDYLLFLVPARPRHGDPPAMRGAFWVNYDCGQSGPWSGVSHADAARLQPMSSGRR